MNDIPLFDEEILNYVKKDDCLLQQLKNKKKKELEFLDEVEELKERHSKDRALAEKLVKSTIEMVEIIQYSGGRWEDYNPTTIRITTDKGVFLADDLRADRFKQPPPNTLQETKTEVEK